MENIRRNPRDWMKPNAERLREHAAHFREQARNARNPQDRHDYNFTAARLERQAEEIERRDA